MMICSLTCALADASEAIGEWYLSEMEANGARRSVVGMIDMIMVLKEDGTVSSLAIVNGDSQVGAGNWTMDGDKITVVINGDSAEFTLADGELSGDMGGAMGYFTREAPIVLPQAIAAESEDAFLGAWLCESISAKGVSVPAAAMGMNLIYVIEPGRAAIAVDRGERTEDTITYNSAFYATELVDGALVLTSEEEGKGASIMQLNDNGQISIAMSLDEAVMTLYFSKIEE